MDSNLLWTVALVVTNTLTSVTTVVLKTFGDRSKQLFEERQEQRKRSISEQDLWVRLGSMEQRLTIQAERITSLTHDLAEARAEVAVLRVDNERMRKQLEQVPAWPQQGGAPREA